MIRNFRLIRALLYYDFTQFYEEPIIFSSNIRRNIGEYVGPPTSINESKEEAVKLFLSNSFKQVSIALPNIGPIVETIIS